MKIRVKTFDSALKLQEFLNGIDVDNNLIQIMQSSHVVGYTTYINYTVVYKSRW
jgi:hypothetical protein